MGYKETSTEAVGFAASRARSMKGCAAGLIAVRFFRVVITTGVRTVDSLISRRLSVPRRSELAAFPNSPDLPLVVGKHHKVPVRYARYQVMTRRHSEDTAARSDAAARDFLRFRVNFCGRGCDQSGAGVGQSDPQWSRHACSVLRFWLFYSWRCRHRPRGPREAW